MTPTPLIDVQNVSYRMGTHTIIDRLSFDIAPQGIVSVIGHNGSGKSTLLQLLLGRLQPSNGRIVKNHNLTMGYVPQRLGKQESLPLTVRDFLGFYNDSIDLDRSICSWLNIAMLIDQQLHTLSGGQLQKVLLYNALLGDPDVLLLDEPTAGLDIASQKDFYSMIEHIHTEHKISMVIVSHDIHTVYSHSDQVICLHQGQCCVGAPQDQNFSSDMHALMGGYVAPYLHQHQGHDH